MNPKPEARNPKPENLERASTPQTEVQPDTAIGTPDSSGRRANRIWGAAG
jgi:hypothetical protein